jgi:hypothetical protein
MECLSRNSSVLEVSNASLAGKIFIETGQIVHAQVADLIGEDALNQLLALSGGQFNLKTFTEPTARTITGQWEFLLMEAARKSDEGKMARDAAASTAATPVEDAARILDSALPSALTSPKSIAFAPAYEPVPVLPPSVPSRPKVDEMLVCSAEGEVLYDWQCLNPNMWVSFFEFISQRGPRLSQTLPLGEFSRVEIESGGARVVVAITDHKGVMVKTRREALNQVIR